MSATIFKLHEYEIKRDGKKYVIECRCGWRYESSSKLIASLAYGIHEAAINPREKQ